MNDPARDGSSATRLAKAGGPAVRALRRESIDLSQFDPRVVDAFEHLDPNLLAGHVGGTYGEASKQTRAA
jgi:hypothetical protein